jgi:NADPH:quinone reductase-like Zn-dependent oxidoreductase
MTIVAFLIFGSEGHDGGQVGLFDNVQRNECLAQVVEGFRDDEIGVALDGRILTCGATAGYAVTTDVRYLWTFEHRVLGSNGWTPDDLNTLMGLIAAGRLEPVVDRVLPLNEVAEGERLLEDREVFGKVLIRP